MVKTTDGSDAVRRTVLSARSLLSLRARPIQIVASFQQVLTELAGPLLIEGFSVRLERGQSLFRFDQTIMIVFEGAHEFQSLIAARLSKLSLDPRSRALQGSFAFPRFA